MSTHIKWFLISVILLSFSGCKISYKLTGASISPETKTFSVKAFPNLAPLVNPTLSNNFEEALKDKFLSSTGLQLIKQNGDLTFEGAIINYQTRPMAIQANSDIAAQNRLTVSIKVKFTNKKDPKASFDNEFSRYADYDSSKSLEDVESTLVNEILEQLIDDIFNKSVVNW